jgi:hypothetical protein
LTDGRKPVTAGDDEHHERRNAWWKIPVLSGIHGELARQVNHMNSNLDKIELADDTVVISSDAVITRRLKHPSFGFSLLRWSA